MSARVLVVDDVPTNIKLLQIKLEAEYFEVLTAEDGPTALRLAAEEAPDIVLLDVMMPEMDGFEVCRRLREDSKTQHVPVAGSIGPVRRVGTTDLRWRGGTGGR